MPQSLEVKTVEEAREEFHRHWKPSRENEVVPVSEAEGLVLSKDAKSAVDLPPFDRSVYDGFAVRAEDTFGAEEDNPVTLRFVGSIMAGQKPDIDIGKGECVEISTGAPMPEDADAVVMVEETSRHEDEVQVRRAVSPRENIKERGSELKKGELIAQKGRKITPRIYGALLASGVQEVEVTSKPRIGVFSSGEELVNTDSDLEIGEIYDVNGPTITSAAKNCGTISEYLGIIRDNRDEIKKKIEESLEEFDALITSGGTSAGSSDLIPKVIDEVGEPGIVIHGLAQKPGKPTYLALIDDKPIFGLPGYPVSAHMVFDQLVEPLLREMSGHPKTGRREIRASLTRKMNSARGRRELVPVRVRRDDGQSWGDPIRKGSGAITSLSEADGYFEIPRNREIVDKGEEVTIRLFDDSLTHYRK